LSRKTKLALNSKEDNLCDRKDMRGKYSRRQFLWFGSAITSILFLKACENTSSPTSDTPTPSKLKAAIVLPGIITDKAWNQAGYEGIKAIEQKLKAEIAYAEQVGQAEQVEAISDFARRGYNLVYAHGGQFDAAIQQVAPQFPDTFFIGVNGAVEGTNMASLRIDHLQASYLCGIIGASMTKSDRMAYITAQSFQATDEELRGFQLGAQSVDPKIKISVSYTGDWNDAAKAKEATSALISSGADVIFQWLDNASPAVLQTASEKKVFAFGTTVDPFDIAPNSVLTTPVKRLDLAIEYIAQLSVEQKLEGKIYTIGLEKPDILYLGKMNPNIPEALKTRVKDTESAIASGKISFESCQEGGGKSTRCIKNT
jgi:basic membrane protein A and related proteins